MVDVGGDTKRIALLGDPIAQVRSPGPLTRHMQARGYDILQAPFHVTPGDLDATVGAMKRVRNLAGFVFTIPHKVAAMAQADRLSTTAALARSINALRRGADGAWYGENFDGVCFVEGLRSEGHDPARRTVMLVGCGGAGASVAASLATAGIARIGIFDLNASRAEATASRLREAYPDLDASVLAMPEMPGADIAVNATFLGMKPGDPLPFDPGLLDAGAVVAEVVMKPPVTALIEVARSRGYPTVLGEKILHHQLDEMLGFFRGSATG